VCRRKGRKKRKISNLGRDRLKGKNFNRFQSYWRGCSAREISKEIAKEGNREVIEKQQASNKREGEPRKVKRCGTSRTVPDRAQRNKCSAGTLREFSYCNKKGGEKERKGAEAGSRNEKGDNVSCRTDRKCGAMKKGKTRGQSSLNQNRKNEGETWEKKAQGRAFKKS